MRKVYLVRHGQSYPRSDNDKFGHLGPPLVEEGVLQAENIDIALSKDSEVASSPMLRAKETAMYAGYNNVVVHDMLKEYVPDGRYEDLYKQLNDLNPPTNLLDLIKSILEHPPKESVWFTHGVIIYGILYELGHRENMDRPLGSVTEITLS